MKSAPFVVLLLLATPALLAAEPSTPGSPKPGDEVPRNPGVAAAAFPIRLTRPVAVGHKSHLTVSATEDTDALGRDGNPAPGFVTRKTGIELDAVITVEELNPIGLPSRVTMTIKSASISDVSGKRDLFAEGATLSAHPEGAVTRYLVGDQPVDPVAARWLNLVYNLSDGKTSDDQMFGSDKPRSVGDTWPADANKVSEKLRAMGLEAEPYNIQASAKLLAAPAAHDQQLLQIQVGFDATQVTLIPDLKTPGVKFPGARLKLQRKTLLAADPSQSDAHIETSSSIEYDAKPVSDAPSQVLRIRTVRHVVSQNVRLGK